MQVFSLVDYAKDQIPGTAKEFAVTPVTSGITNPV